MAHGLILGMSESGKTTLGKHLSHAFYNSGKSVIILDPMNDPGFAGDFKTTKPAEFLDVFWTNQNCFCLIDESAITVGRYDELMQETATRGRHHGHSVFFISQRGAQISATVRAQCRHLYLFCSAKDDCKILANEFNQQTLLQANSLPQFHFYHASRFGGCQIQKLENPHELRPVQSVSQTDEKSNSAAAPPAGSDSAARNPAGPGSASGSDTGGKPAAERSRIKHS